jgi:hypothetical protein
MTKIKFVVLLLLQVKKKTLNIHTIKHTINTKNLNSNKQKINKKLKVKLFKKIKETVLQILLNTKHFENVNLIFYKWV